MAVIARQKRSPFFDREKGDEKQAQIMIDSFVIDL
jgi:hypothetical protein